MTKIALVDFTLALWYLEKAVRLAQEARRSAQEATRLAIQSQCYADLSQEIDRIYKVNE